MTKSSVSVCNGRRLLAGVWVMLALAACGGGSGGGSNSGQDPDPVVVDMPLAYVQRAIPLDEDGEPVYPSVFEPDAFNPGAELFLKDRPTVQAAVVNITASAFVDDPNFTPETPNYDVKDLTTSLDGKKLAFAMRAPEIPDADDDEQPTWNIWEYELASGTLRRVISSNIEAEKGNDVSPRYLPDGRILFVSDRQKRAKEILLDEGKPQFGAVNENDGDITAFHLHSMKSDGTDIQQLSFNQSHDIAPSLLPDGRVLYIRWDGVGNLDQLSFYTANPDGTNVQRYFGYNSLNVENEETGEIPRLFRPVAMPDGRIAAIYMYNETQLGGDMVVIDPLAAAEGEVESISVKPVDITPGLVSLHGRFASLAPLYDGTNRLLVSWSQCRLLETALERLRPCLPDLLVEGEPVEGYEEAEPLYGIWIYDMTNQTQLPVVLAEDGKLFTEAIALENLANPPAYIEPETDLALAAEAVGLLHIRSVYDTDGSFNAMGSGAANLAELAARPAELRPARFVRIIKAVSVPDDDTLDDQPDEIYANTYNQVNGLQEILGYSPVEPDGSVMVKVPADVAFTLEILDANGRQISRNHNYWLNLRPGETMTCHGCHDPANTSVVHGRRDLEPTSINTGAATVASFPNTQRYDELGAPLVPEMGQTMAEFAAVSTYCTETGGETTCFPMAGPGQERNLRELTVDLLYRDEWSAPGISPSDAISLRYNDLVPGANADDIPAPTPTACREPQSWTANCRVVINYEYHIQPLWERERPELGGANCMSCHSPADAEGNIKVPSGQLELTRTKIQANARMTSYNQLLNGNQRLIQFIYEDRLATSLPACEFEDVYDFIPECVVEVDENDVPICSDIDNCQFEVLDPLTGVLELDDMGNPIPIMVDTGALPPPMSRGAANNSNRFFDRFALHWDVTANYKTGAIVFYDPLPGDATPGWTFQARVDNVGATPDVNQAQTPQWQRLRERPWLDDILENTVDHAGALNPAELKLLSEWLDTNGQYYANPFEVTIPN